MAAELFMCCFGAIVGDQLNQLGFAQVDLMCSFSPTAWRLDQLVIIAPLPD